MSTEHQSLKDEGDALARAVAYHKMAQTKPSAHEHMQVAAWERRCALAGVDSNMEALVELWTYAFSESMQKKSKKLLDHIWSGGVFDLGVLQEKLGDMREIVLRDPMGSPEDEISSYPIHVSILPAEMLFSAPDSDGLNRKERRALAARRAMVALEALQRRRQI